MKKIVYSWALSKRLHLLIWTLFILYETAVVGILFSLFANPVVYLVHYAIIISIFYLHSDFILPRLMSTEMVFKPLYISFAVIVLIIIYIMMHYIADLGMIKVGLIQQNGKYQLSFAVIARNLYRGLYFIGFSTGFYYLKKYLLEKKERQILDNNRLQDIIRLQEITQLLSDTEIKFLKAQINPHFLFNTLDFIYHESRKSAPLAGEAILRLAQIMRYAISSSINEFGSSLAQEIEQVNNLIYLNQIGSSREQFVSFHYSNELEEVQFPPLIVLTLVENIFKHGEIHDRGHEANIRLSINDNLLLLETENLSKNKAIIEESNLGLSNISRQLILAFGEKSNLQYGQYSDGYFRTRVEVKFI